MTTAQNSTVTNTNDMTPADSQTGSQSGPATERKSSTVNLTGKGYIGAIRQHIPAGGEAQYYVNVSLLNGEDQEGKTKYLRASVRVKKDLVPMFEKAYSTQAIDGDNNPVHTLSNQLMNIGVYAPDFTHWQKDGNVGVNGEGLLTKMTAI